METKKCKECGRELPVTNFMKTRWGIYSEVCKGCVQDKKNDTRNANTGQGINRGGKQNAACSDPEFDGKQPVEVLQMMKRAKMWLESKGYTITLKGTYTVTKEVKF